MITSAGIFDWAVQAPGPDAKSGYPGFKDSRPSGVVYHSAEGYRGNLLALVTDLKREASWTASNMKDGAFYQHYPVTRIVWTNGSKNANLKFRGVESEGVAGEPLTQPQIDNLTRCAQDMAAFFSWPSIKRHSELFEHNEMTAYGSLPTACPSGRIPWAQILAGLEDDMGYAEDIAAIKAELAKQAAVNAEQTETDKAIKAVLAEHDGRLDVLEAQAPTTHTHETGPPK